MAEIVEYTTLEISFEDKGIVAIIKFPQGKPREAVVLFKDSGDKCSDDPSWSIPFSVISEVHNAFIDRFAAELA